MTVGGEAPWRRGEVGAVGAEEEWVQVAMALSRRDPGPKSFKLAPCRRYQGLKFLKSVIHGPVGFSLIFICIVYIQSNIQFLSSTESKLPSACSSGL